MEASPTSPVPVSSLRSEIVESQKADIEFVKWKLIAVAAVTSILFGVGSDRERDPQLQLLIFLIPLICAYVDLVSITLAMRILTIAAFLREQNDIYECRVHQMRTNKGRNPFMFVPVAVHGSSLAISLVIFSAGIFGWQTNWDHLRTVAYLSAGAIGIALATILWRSYRLRAKHLATLGPCDKPAA